MDSVSFLRSIPVWVQWLMLAGLFFFIELIHASWVVLWFGFGALAAVLVALIFPDAIPYQIGIFFLVSLLLVVFARSIALTLFFPKGKVEKFDPGPIGKEVVCLEEIDNHNSKGAVRLYGIPWNARSDDDDMIIAAGQRAKIVKLEGNTVIVSPI